MISREVLENGEKALEKELNKLFSKAELSPADWDAVKKAMCILNMMRGYENGEMVNEEGMSYGYSARSYVPMHHYGEDRWDDGYSNARGRSPVTGRYISRGEMGTGYSGHSIEDRMIMALEQQMDSAKTDYERQQVEKEIKRLRRGE